MKRKKLPPMPAAAVAAALGTTVEALQARNAAAAERIARHLERTGATADAHGNTPASYRRTFRNPNGTTKTYHGEEAEQLTAREWLEVQNRTQALGADILDCMVEPPAKKVRAKLTE